MPRIHVHAASLYPSLLLQCYCISSVTLQMRTVQASHCVRRTSLNRPGSAAHAAAALDAARTPDSVMEPRPMSAPAANASVTSAVAIHASISMRLDESENDFEWEERSPSSENVLHSFTGRRRLRFLLAISLSPRAHHNNSATLRSSRTPRSHQPPQPAAFTRKTPLIHERSTARIENRFVSRVVAARARMAEVQ